MSGPLIYNIFPLLAGKTDQWIKWADHARRMGFEWVYFNPVQNPGFSGSLYSIKDYYSINPLFLLNNEETGYEEVELAFREIRQMGLRIMVDLVINHTAIDSPLVQAHPSWYKQNEEGEIEHPSAIDPADSRNVTVWGDLYEIDNDESPDREALWRYWTDFVLHMVRLGVQGFRCDAAYKVPALLWARLIKAANEETDNTVLFFAETLGCRLEEVALLKEAGFNYLYNSSKYWNFDSSWAIDQHEVFQQVAPSVSFPESHDTERLFISATEKEQVMKQRIAFTGAFSEGMQITMGMEYGWNKSCDVVTSRPGHQEAPSVNLVEFLHRFNTVRKRVPVLNEEGSFDPHVEFHKETIVLHKRSLHGDEGVFVIINKNWDQTQWVDLPFALYVLRVFHSGECSEHPLEGLQLEPAEVVFGFLKRV
ncbi:alpha-amylase [Myxococcota bacterium]|nr:alpha-amylase [Myxococcota bacterium]